MKSFFVSWPWLRWSIYSACVLVCLGLASCGGGSSLAGGVGTGGSGLAEGSVSGFGSVIVDGVEYDDTNATVLVDNAQGQTDLGEVKLGQRVRITHSQAGVADEIRVLPQLRGSASSAANAEGWFQMLGQWVQIVATSDTLNTPTVLDGLSTVSANDELEVHGAWVFDSLRNASVLVASRIEKLSGSADPVTISGVVRSRSGNTVVLDDSTGTRVQYNAMPSGIDAHSLITAWVARSALGTQPWVATRLVDASPAPSGQEHVVLGTQISNRDIAQGVVQVQGLSVKLPSVMPNAPPLPGTPVQLDIVRDGDGWKAVSLTLRQLGNDLGASVALKGSIVWPSSNTQLSLRDTTVAVPPDALATNCGPVQAGDSVYVDITAQRMAPGQPLRASHVSCDLQIPEASVIEVSGRVTQVDTNNKRLVLQTSKGSLSLVWTTSTVLPSRLDTLLNQNTEVTYQVVSGVNRLRKVKPD